MHSWPASLNRNLGHDIDIVLDLSGSRNMTSGVMRCLFPKEKSCIQLGHETVVIRPTDNMDYRHIYTLALHAYNKL